MLLLQIFLIVFLTLVSGCGFKSDLFLPDEQVIQRPTSIPLEPTASEPHESDSEDTDEPGILVDIPPLNEQQRSDKKKK